MPLQKVPVLDGASGLHYSGRIYTNQYPQMSQNICNGLTATLAQLNDVYANGVSRTDLPIDDATKRISTAALQGHVENLKTAGVVPGQLAEFDTQMKADKDFYAAVQAEYCFYEARYTTALAEFMAEVSSAQGADPTTTQNILNQTIALNKRLNSLLEVIGYVGNERARNVNERNNKIDKANEDIDNKIGQLKAQQDFLQSGDVRVRTQEEMMRYSKEKNTAMNIQMMFFVALNVVALGTVFFVYKSVKPNATL